jgi:hypothetical protein
MGDKLREFEKRSERFRHLVTIVLIIVTLYSPSILGIADKIGDFILE